MKQPTLDTSWPASWKLSYEYDLMEVFGQPDAGYGYAYTYRERHKRTVDAVRRHVPTGGRILDVAAAQGNFTLALAELGYRVTWNDLRDELVDYVRLKHETGDVRFAPGNCFDLTSERPFDAVLITEIIEHVAHPDRFLRKIRTMVKPSGIIVMTTPNGEYFRYDLPKFSECPDPAQYEAVQFKPNADGHIFLLHADEVEDMAAQADLHLRDLDLFANPLTHGHMKSEYILRILPKTFVDAVESVTSAGNGKTARQLNAHMLAVFQRPDEN